jgi:hypothetical protein
MSRGATYRKRQDGNAMVFETTPAKTPISLFMLALGVICVSLALGEPGIGITYSVFAIICLVVAFRDPARGRTARP